MNAFSSSSITFLKINEAIIPTKNPNRWLSQDIFFSTFGNRLSTLPAYKTKTIKESIVVFMFFLKIPIKNIKPIRCKHRSRRMYRNFKDDNTRKSEFYKAWRHPLLCTQYRIKSKSNFFIGGKQYYHTIIA